MCNGPGSFNPKAVETLLRGSLWEPSASTEPLRASKSKFVAQDAERMVLIEVSVGRAMKSLASMASKINENYIVARYQRAARNQLILLGAIAVALGALYVQPRALRFWNSFSNGPARMQEFELTSIVHVESIPVYWVRVKGQKAVDLGIETYRIRRVAGVETSRELVKKFYALEVGDKWLLVEGGTELRQDVTGALEAIPDSLRREIFQGEFAVLERRFYPFYLSSHDFELTGYAFLILGAGMLGGLAYLGLRPARTLAAPGEQKEISRLCDGDALDGLPSLLEKELEAPIFTKGRLTVTDSFVVLSQPLAFHASVWRDLLWAYRTETTHRWLFIPIRTTHHANLVFSNFTFALPCSEADAITLMQLAVHRAPWAVFGYSAEVETIAQKYLPQLEQAVRKRRSELAS